MTGTAAQTPVMDVMEIPAEPQVFQSGTQSTELELVDTYLWIFKHFMEGKELTRSLACQVYIKPYSDRMDSVTFQSVAKRVTNGAIVIHTQRLKSDPGGNLLS